MFDPGPHTYHVDGVLVPNVTRVLAVTGFIDDRWFTEYSRERGSAIHKWCQYLQLGNVKASDCTDERIAGYVQAYEQFMKDTRFKASAIEEIAYDPVHRVVCTVDLVGMLGNRPTIIDDKSGGPEDWHGFQTATQEVCVGTPSCPAYDRYGLHLKKNGKYILEPHRRRTDRGVALAALTVYNHLPANRKERTNEQPASRA